MKNSQDIAVEDIDPTLEHEIISRLFSLDHVTNKQPGAAKIAERLWQKGSCITTAHAAAIWVGGIGNFIKTESTEEAVGCIVLKLDKESVKKWPTFANVLKDLLERAKADAVKAAEEAQRIQKRYTQLASMLTAVEPDAACE